MALDRRTVCDTQFYTGPRWYVLKLHMRDRKIDKRVSSLRSGNNQTIRTEIHPAWKRQIKSDSSPNIMSTSFTSEGLMTCQAVHVLHVRTTRRVVLLLQGQ